MGKTGFPEASGWEAGHRSARERWAAGVVWVITVWTLFGPGRVTVQGPGGFGQGKAILKSQGVGSDSISTVQTTLFAVATEEVPHARLS